jgi:YfiH family protein
LSSEPLLDARLADLGVAHGFGVRGSIAPEGCLRPRQVHGRTVVRAEEWRASRPAPEADAVVATRPGTVVGVVTADCVPILLAAGDGTGVAAVHAGWRGLARGVVQAGVEALLHATGASASALVAAVGPHIGPCCYEVDAPVLDALAAGLGGSTLGAARPVRSGHWMLDLAALTAHALERAGLSRAEIGTAAASCTACERERFHSYRRDGPRAGRLVHFVAVPRPSRSIPRRLDTAPGAF